MINPPPPHVLQHCCGYISFELLADKVLKMEENFCALNTGEKGFGDKGVPAFTELFRGMCQGGSFTYHNDTGGKSLYSKEFDDENFVLKHTAPGILSMVNAGPHTNGSQFFICTAKSERMDGQHVAFGKVKDGMSVVEALEPSFPGVYELRQEKQKPGPDGNSQEEGSMVMSNTKDKSSQDRVRTHQ
ncbi:hypothetical protein P7K49_024468 [Saguinus oedipus]|uniref:Peptidyl-prolyl cis-trans isomerase n=1 Tax=Saguinus oedipus TaxID=9490 RepID=A0ABQ9UPK5_SAGOE|nr:hypothetical protein P7K49_024468 [Saguinus oedipus]